MYEERKYREIMKPEDMINFTVIVEESDLNISAKSDLTEDTADLLKKFRKEIKENDDEFFSSLVPVESKTDSPEIIKHMCMAAKTAGVGPMAAVAGAVSEYIGKELLKKSDEVIIENGGDIFIKTNHERKILIYAGDSPFSNKISLIVKPEMTPLGVCTSAGTVGHSLSFGKADAVVVVAKDTLIADACATAIGNIVKTPEDVDDGIQFAKSVKQITGVIIIIQNKLGIWGDIEITR